MDTHTLLARLPAGFALKPVTAERYADMLNIMPPLAWVDAGFLMGEPYDHRTCGIGGYLRASYSVFVDRRGDRPHYEGTHALTAPEWRALAGNPAAIAACIKRGAA
jgi:hypothetical protein